MDMLKKLFICIAAAAVVFSFPAYAEEISDGTELGQTIGEFSVTDTNSGKYIVNHELEIIGGPFAEVSDYSGYVYATREDGTGVMLDLDGSVLADVSADDSIFAPENGLYAIARGLPFGEDYSECKSFELYDYATRERLCTLDRVILFYLEQQTDKMVIENEEGKCAFINKYGELQSDYVYDEVKKRFNPDYEPYPKAYAIVVRNGVEKYIDWDLNEIDLDNYNGEQFITNCSYPLCSEDYYILESGEKTALYDIENQKYVFPFQTEYRFGVVSDDGIIAAKDDKYGILGFDQSIIAPFEYDYLAYDGAFFNYTVGTEQGFIKNGRKVFSSNKAHSLKFCGNGIILMSYRDPNESYEYAHNYTDYVEEIVNFAGHNLTGTIYTDVRYDGENFLTTTQQHEAPSDVTNVASDFAVINLNGEYLDFDGVIRDERTLVPVREIVEGLGGTVDWDGENQAVNAVIDGKSIELEINSCIMTVGGTKQTIDVPAQIIADKTMLPVRAVSEAVGAQVEWDGLMRCVYINK